MLKEIEAIFIIAGHSKYNKGASKDGLFERNINKIVAEQLSYRLDNIASPILIYEIGIDEDISLEDKVKKVNDICIEYGYDVENSLLIEVHTNAGGGTGSETLIYDGYKPAIELSNLLLQNTCELNGLKNRGVKNGKEFTIIKKTIPLAIIYETAFIDTVKDREVLTSDLNSFSEGLYQGLKEYIGFEVNNEQKIIEKLIKENKELQSENDLLNRKLEVISEIIAK